MTSPTSTHLVVPFNEHARVQFAPAEPGASIACIPDAHELTNHLGTVHGGALFTVAEAASGRAFMDATLRQAEAAHWDLRGFRAVVRNAQIRFRKPARGVISAHARVVTPAAEWANVLEQQGKATAKVLVEVRDAADVLVAEMDVEWHVARAP
jgi:acyl-coenzyme A thioesterase PaaI-like protein